MELDRGIQYRLPRWAGFAQAQRGEAAKGVGHTESVWVWRSGGAWVQSVKFLTEATVCPLHGGLHSSSTLQKPAIYSLIQKENLPLSFPNNDIQSSG